MYTFMKIISLKISYRNLCIIFINSPESEHLIIFLGKTIVSFKKNPLLFMHLLRPNKTNGTSRNVNFTYKKKGG